MYTLKTNLTKWSIYQHSTAGGVKANTNVYDSKYQVSSQDTRVKRAYNYFKSFTFLQINHFISVHKLLLNIESQLWYLQTIS